MADGLTWPLLRELSGRQVLFGLPTKDGPMFRFRSLPGNAPHLRARSLFAAMGVTIVAASVLSGFGQSAQAATASTNEYASTTIGTAALVPPHSTASTAASASRQPRGVRHAPTPLSRQAAATVTGPASLDVASSAVQAALLRNFNGTSSRDSEVTNFNAKFEPPDQGLCVGNGFVLEAVNSAYSIYQTNGKLIRGPFNVNDLFNEGAAEFTSDPRCYFDAATNTWFAVILFINSDSTLSRVDLAVNTSGDPTNLWTQYQIDTSDDGRLGEPSHPGCPCLGDQPLLGIDQFNIYISTNEFSLLGPQFNGAQIYAVAKSDLLSGQAQAHVVHFDKLAIGGAVAASVQPALNRGAPEAEYFMNSLDPNGTFDNRLGVWAMTNRGAVASGGKPTLSSTVITSEPYAIPPGAEQKGSTSLLDSGDDRMQQTQFVGGELWGELDTSVTIPNDPAARAGAAWFAVHPTLNGKHIASAVIDRQGYVVSSQQYVLYPAIQADAAGAGAMVFTLTSANRFPSAAFALISGSGSNFGSPTVAAAGTGPYDPVATRWGDYSFAVPDPTSDAVWMATEYIPPVASQTSTGQRNWGTRVIEVNLG
jgi:hypothetical protein